MNFNPATFFDSTAMGSAAAKRLEQRDDIDHQPRVPVAALLRRPIPAAAPAVSPDNARFIAELERAAARFAVRRDTFAAGKEATCLDLAQKLAKFGCWASDRQGEFARKLIGWSLPRGAAHPLDAQEAAQGSKAAPRLSARSKAGA